MATLYDRVARDFARHGLAKWGRPWTYLAPDATETEFYAVFTDRAADLRHDAPEGITQDRHGQIQFLAVEVADYESYGYLDPETIDPRGTFRPPTGGPWRPAGGYSNQNDVATHPIRKMTRKKVGRG